MPDQMTFVINGKIKPYVRMTHRSKWVDKQAQEYRASQRAIGWQLKTQMQQNDWAMLPPRKPIRVAIEFIISGRMHNSDLDNMGKALRDAAQQIVYKNDCWIDEIKETRRAGPENLAILHVGEIKTDERKLSILKK